MLRDRLTHLLASRYLVGEELAGGGMARVFAAHDPALDRAVVIKVLPPERAGAVAVERFRREARLLARLSHPHIVPVIESGETDGLFWFIMPRVAGQPLDQVLERGPLDETTVRRLGLELLDALAHAHGLGVVHRDVKPANILVHADHALLADFGVALLRESSDDALTDSGQAVGTLAYMAPEQRSGKGDARSDCWSVGATLFEAATGSRWDGGASKGRWGGVPPALGPALRRALADDPAERWRDAAAFRDALQASPRPAAWHWHVGAGLAAAALVVAAWGAITGPRHATQSPPDSLDLAVVAPGAREARVTDAARQAGLLLQWFPSLAVARDGDDRPARIRVEIEERVDGDGSVLAVIGVAADGTLIFSRHVPRGVGEGRDVARAVVAELFRDRLVDFDQFGRSGNSVQGWRAFYDGLEAFQAGRFAAADTALARAVSHDSAFVAAAWVRSLARMWQREDIAPSLARLAESSALPPPLGALVAAQRDPDIRRRLAVFDSVVETHPNYPAARMLLANELFHRGPIVGMPLRVGIDAFRTARRETPVLDHVNTAEQLLWGAIRIGDEETARAALARLRGHPDPLRHEVLLLAFDSRFQPMAATVRSAALRLAARGRVLPDLARYLRFGLLFDLPALQRRFADAVLDATDDPALAANAAAARATALLMEGRPAAALEALALADALAPRPGAFRPDIVEWYLLLPRFGVPVDPDSTRAAAAEARARASGEGRARMQWMLAIRDAPSAAGRREDWSDSLRRTADEDPVADHLAALAVAQQRAGAGAIREALARSAVIELDPGDALALARGSLTRALVKFERGAWQLALGDTAGAVAEWTWIENNDLQGWPVGGLQEGELDAALSPLVRLHRAVLLCASGDRAAGQADLRRVQQLWHRAEPSMRRLPVYLEAGEQCR